MGEGRLKNPHHKIWAIAGPAILANSATPLVGLVDTWVIGHIPDSVHLAAIGVGTMVFNYLFWAFGFLRMSTTGLVAQAYGKGNTDQLARVVIRSLLLGNVIAAGLLISQTLLSSAALVFLRPPSDTIPLFQAYFDIRIWASPATLIFFSINGYLIGTAQAKKSLYLQLLLNGLNAALNLIFVLGFHMGVAGIALGSLIAEWVAAGAGLMMLISGIGSRPLGAMLKSRLTYEAAKMKALLQTNGYLFLRTLLLIAAFALVTRFSASLGKDALAASHIMTTFLILIALGLDGFAYAVEALSGAAYGRKALQEFKNSVSYGFLWAGAAAIFYSISFYLFGDMLVETLTTIDTVKEQMAILTPMLVVLPLISVWSYQFDGIYVGATASGAMFFTMIFAFAPFALTASYFTEAYGLTGIWGAFIIFLGLRGLTQAFYYPRLKHKLSNPKK